MINITNRKKKWQIDFFNTRYNRQQQNKRITSGDNLDLTGSGINAVEAITSSSTVTSKDIKITGYTTSERDVLTPVRGQFIYNTSSDPAPKVTQEAHGNLSAN